MTIKTEQLARLRQLRTEFKALADAYAKDPRAAEVLKAQARTQQTWQQVKAECRQLRLF
jgi:hypothetical protein